LGKDSEWTRKRADARDFVRGTDAIAYAARHRLRDVCVLYTFPNPAHDVSLRLAD